MVIMLDDFLFESEAETFEIFNLLKLLFEFLKSCHVGLSFQSEWQVFV
jgi:hypothetical protein